MFWNKSPKLPVTPEDKEWIEESMIWIKQIFDADYFIGLDTILPNKNYYNCNFNGQQSDAEFVLEQTKIYMDIDREDIKLDFFSDSPVEMADGTLLSTPSDNINGSWKSATGTYESDGNNTIIRIEKNQLKNTTGLIATIAHELCHEILLGEGYLEENDEYLTDLLAVAYGFGIFLGNSCHSFNKFRTAHGSGWESASTGYLPEQVIAYAMAWLCIYRNEEPVWKTMLNPTILKYFNQGMEYIKTYPDKVRFE